MWRCDAKPCNLVSRSMYKYPKALNIIILFLHTTLHTTAIPSSTSPIMKTTYVNLRQFLKRKMGSPSGQKQRTKRSRTLDADRQRQGTKRSRTLDVDGLNTYYQRKLVKEDQNVESCRCCRVVRFSPTTYTVDYYSVPKPSNATPQKPTLAYTQLCLYWFCLYLLRSLLLLRSYFLNQSFQCQ